MAFNRTNGFNRAPFNHTAFSDVLYAAPLEAETTTEGQSIASFVLAELILSGAIAVGQTVCINSKNFTVKKDGVNFIDKFDGDFPDIRPGENEITYTDGEASRTVLITVSRTDRQI